MTKQTKRVLLIDDDLPPRRELRRAFEAADKPEYAFEVFEADSVEAYQTLVKQQRFDVMIVDLRLVSEEEGTSEVISPHIIHSPGTIIIVYSAFPSLRPVPSCVRAMRAGAVECIEKGAEHSIRSVLESAYRELLAQESPDVGPSSEWLDEHFSDLIKKYGGKAIAFVGLNVVAAAENVGQLRNVLREMTLQGPPHILIVPEGDKSE